MRPSPLPLDGDELAARQSRLESLVASRHPYCLLCGTGNPLGLKLAFRVQEDGAVLAALPCPGHLQSYPDTLHGGVTSALLDAAMTNALFSLGVLGVTADLRVRFLAPVRPNRTAVVRGWTEKSAHCLYYTVAELEQDGRVVARATAKFMAGILRPPAPPRDRPGSR